MVGRCFDNITDMCFLSCFDNLTRVQLKIRYTIVAGDFLTLNINTGYVWKSFFILWKNHSRCGYWPSDPRSTSAPHLSFFVNKPGQKLKKNKQRVIGAVVTQLQEYIQDDSIIRNKKKNVSMMKEQRERGAEGFLTRQARTSAEMSM